MLETAERITRTLARPKKPKLRRLGRSWDPVLTQGGSIIRLHKPGVQEWPYVREKISFGAIVEEVMADVHRGKYQKDDKGWWYRVGDWPTKRSGGSRGKGEQASGRGGASRGRRPPPPEPWGGP